MVNNYALQLIIIRHGTTASNLEGRMVGNTDDKLTEQSRLDIAAMIARWPYPPVDMLVRSPLRRCGETAQIIYPSMEARVIDGLREVQFGDCERQKLTDVLTMVDSDAFFNRDPSVQFPGGESFQQANERITAAIGEVITLARRESAASVGIVTHGLIMDVLLHNHVRPALTPEQLFLANGYGISIGVDVDEWHNDGKLNFIALLPEGAERPPLSDSPFAKMYSSDM